ALLPGRARDRGRPDPAPDEPPRARLRVQPRQLLLLLPGRRARLHHRRGQQHLRRAAPLPPLAREPGHERAPALLPSRQEAPRFAVLRPRPDLPVVALRGRRAACRAHRRQRGQRAAVLRHAQRAPAASDRRDPRPRAAPLPADAAAGDRPDPPPGREALAEARAVLPQAAVRARRGIGETVTEALRELPTGRRFGARLAESAALRALGRIEHGALELRLPGGRRVYR